MDMKAKENSKMDAESKRKLLTSIAAKLKGREFFPQRNEEVRNLLKNAKPLNW
jgi:hypothetical protein